MTAPSLPSGDTMEMTWTQCTCLTLRTSPGHCCLIDWRRRGDTSLLFLRHRSKFLVTNEPCSGVSIYVHLSLCVKSKSFFAMHAQSTSLEYHFLPKIMSCLHVSLIVTIFFPFDNICYMCSCSMITCGKKLPPSLQSISHLLLYEQEVFNNLGQCFR